MTKYFFVVATFAFFMVSCNSSPKTKSGLEYKIFVSNGGDKIGPGDYVFFKVVGKAGDSVIYDTYKNTQTPYMVMNLKDKIDAGNFEEGLTLLGKGDSAMFKINADSFFNVNVHSPAPSFIKKGTNMVFYVKIDSFITKKVITEREAQQQLMVNEEMKEQSLQADAYMAKSGLKFTKTNSGLYYTITKATKGATANKGDIVAANYTGSLLDGNVFDSNKDRGPFEFELGAQRVIMAWDEIFSILHVGEKATIVVPSQLGYGAQGSGPLIKPNATLIFDVEFIKFTKK